MQNLRYARAVELWLALEQPRLDQFAGKRAFDEHDLARVARDAAAGGIERLNFQQQSQESFQSCRNSRQWALSRPCRYFFRS